MEGFIPCDKDQERLYEYARRQNEETQFIKALAEGRKVYDKK
jgi:hypothetical protein